MRNFLIFLWAVIWGLPLVGVLVATAMLLPSLASLIFAGGVGILVTVLGGILLLGLAGCYIFALIGIFDKWYFSWVWISAANYLAPFILGLSMVAVTFLAPFEIGSWGLLLLLGGALKLSFFVRDYWQAESVQDEYEVSKYTAVN
ncbi:hypothetical protein [Teredinibacter sp. KSP-S5-2]|uniref:hypothetical protein n=1 Tax=Teredinibacter sp. KSP-S5-2 TaxID=3034506 RepID=UPI0029342CBF|nr:hypothetical protein [Teredinibacter sp. KSP-S5-2]WNO10152.1 hypothetical protein P5V12_03100 [Teredinibacter sp. KSP-S5-2]